MRYENGNDEVKAGIVDFTKEKLLLLSSMYCISADGKVINPLIALAIPYLAVFDTCLLVNFAPCLHQVQAQLVEKNMHVVFSVPEHRKHISSGYPSEPILAEAAAQHMHQETLFW
jgi:hypothetical protein